MSRFTNKVVFISGGASGIGLAATQRLAGEGAKVVIADINWDLAQKAATSVGKGAVAVKMDQGDAASVKEAIATAEKTLGGIDYAVNAAGIQGPQASVEDIEPEDIQRVYAVNVMGVAYCMKYQLAAIKKRGGGAIVNIASVAGIELYLISESILQPRLVSTHSQQPSHRKPGSMGSESIQCHQAMSTRRSWILESIVLGPAAWLLLGGVECLQIWRML